MSDLEMALGAAWTHLCSVPLAVSSEFATQWILALEAIHSARTTLLDSSPKSCFDAKLEELRTALVLLRTAADDNEDVACCVRKIRAEFCNAATDILNL